MEIINTHQEQKYIKQQNPTDEFKKADVEAAMQINSRIVDEIQEKFK